MEQNQLFDLNFEPQTLNYFSEAAKWGKFLSIIGFIFCGLMVLLGIFAGSTLAALGGSEAVSMIGGGFFTAFYIIIAIIWVMPFVYLYNFSSKMQVAIRNNDQQTLNHSIKNLKSLFKFLGIFTIIMLSLYALIFIFGIAAGIGSAF